MNTINPKVENYLSKAKIWRAEMEQLRMILLDCGLTEELKWGKPCYTFQESNIVVIQGFKAYCAILFFKGMLLKDPDQVLIITGENTRVGRQMRFNNVDEIVEMELIVKKYVAAAVEIEKAGLKVAPKEKEALVLVQEFQDKLKEMPALKKAFNALTPGRQRAYNSYFSSPKQSKTRESRIEKYIPQILNGKGLMD